MVPLAALGDREVVRKGHILPGCQPGNDGELWLKLRAASIYDCAEGAGSGSAVAVCQCDSPTGWTSVRDGAVQLEEHCLTIESLADADDGKAMFIANATLELVEGACVCIQPDCTTEADITFEIDETGTATETAVTGTATCEDGDASETATALSGTMHAMDVLTFSVDNTPTAGDDYVICVWTTETSP